VSSGVGAVLLAGGRTKGELLARTRQPYRALIPVGGRTLLEHTMAALAAARTVEYTIVVGPAECRPWVSAVGGPFGWMPMGETMVDNLLAGVHSLGSEAETVLACAADAPLISGPLIDRIVSVSHERGHAFCYPIVEREVCQAAFPEGKRTYVRLRDGRFTGGNVLTASRRLLLEHHERIAEVFAARKSPLKLASLLGLGLALRLPLGLVSVRQAEQRAGQILGFPVSAWICDDPAVGVDVDKVADLDTVEAALAQLA
jgi:CTP:molybdopterin cytidylyltransferase MocA